MKCPRCQSEIEGDAAFCTACGSPLQADHASAATPPATAPACAVTPEPAQTSSSAETLSPKTAPISQNATAPQKKSKTGFIIGIIAAIIAVIIIAAVLFLVVFNPAASQENPPNNIETTTEETSESSSNAASAASPNEYIYEYVWGTIELPKELDEIIYFKAADQGQGQDPEGTVNIYDRESDVFMGKIFYILPEYENEMKSVTYTLGNSYFAGSTHEVFLSVAYVNKENKNMHWGANDGELSFEKYCHISPEAFGDYIYLKTSEGYVAADVRNRNAPQSNYSAGNYSGTRTPSPTPFWGIWIGASKDKSEMEQLVNKARAQGFNNAGVYMTSDWSNLNSETWYVATVGEYASESAANAALPQAKSSITSSAYVKYTGSFKG